MGFAGFGDLGFDFDIDFDAFDFEGAEADPLETCVYTRPIAHKPATVAYERADELARELIIDNETETFAFISGNFVFGDLLEALVRNRRLTIRRLGIQTLSMSEENIDSIRNVLEMTPVDRLDLVLSDYWYAHESHKTGLVGYLFDQLDLDGLDLHVAFAGVHCKVTTIETLRGNVLTMHGSANLRSSGNVEQVCISPDRGLFDFCDAMAQRVLEAYDVVNQGNRKRKKSVRRTKLWQAMTTPEGSAEEEASEGTRAPETEGPSRTPRTSEGSPTHTGKAGRRRQETPCTTTSSSESVGGPPNG